MNELMNVSEAQTMSSREIAELTGKEHDNVRRDILKMAQELSLNFEEKVLPSNGGIKMLILTYARRWRVWINTGFI